MRAQIQDVLDRARHAVHGTQPGLTPAERPPVNRNQIVTGVIVLLVGFAFLLDRADVLDVHRVWEYWPLLLVGIGVTQILMPAKDGRGSGWWLVFVGVILGLHKFDILRLRDSWPLFIVAFGVSLVVQALNKRRGART